MTSHRSALFYNLDNGRSPDRVQAELDELLGITPSVLAFCEGFGYTFARRKDYQLLHGSRLLGTQATPGNLNVGAYVHKSLDVRSWAYMAHQATWERPDKRGHRHWPRETLHAVLEDLDHRQLQLVVGHRPPNTRLNDTGPAQAEWDTDVSRLLKRGKASRRRLCLADFQEVPVSLAVEVGGELLAHRIDNGIAVNVRVGRAFYVSKVGKAGAPLRSDHRSALLAYLDI